MLFQLPGLGTVVREAAIANVSLRKFASVLIFIILVYLSSAGHSNSARIMKHRNYRQGFKSSAYCIKNSVENRLNVYLQFMALIFEQLDI